MPNPQGAMSEEQRRMLEEKIKNMSPEELREFQKQQCIFCQIIAGKIPSKKVYEDDLCQAILDVNPAAKGHLLLLPKEHYAIMPQVPDNILGHLFAVAKKLSQIMLKVLKSTGTNIFIANGPAAGQRSQHFLLHLIPRTEGDELFAVQEKLIGKELLQKVKLAVSPILAKMLGVKTPGLKQPPAAHPVHEELLPGKETKEEKIKQREIEKPEQFREEQKGAEEKEKQKGEETRQKKAKRKTKSAATEKKQAKSPQQKSEETSEQEEGIDLDDIASLFQ